MTDEATDTNTLPATCSVAFKEWAGVCRALEDGRQTIILRKGGIDEGPHGFVPDQRTFWLYPTHVHQAQQGLLPDAEPIPPDVAAEGNPSVPLRGVAVVAMVERLGTLEQLEALDGLHVWTRETLFQRFHYRSPGLWVIGVRVHVGTPGHRVAVTPEHAGCKTWVPLGEALSTAEWRPVLGDREFSERMDELSERLGSAARMRPGTA